MTDDPLWPRASAWLEANTREHAWPRERHPRKVQMALLGVPAFRTSLSPTRADTTPAAVRGALARFSTYVSSRDLDLADLMLVDLGDQVDPDTPDGERRTIEAVRLFPEAMVLAVGGDNSITYAVAHGSCADGLITLDAHHDLRDGRSNGSPVRRIIEEGGMDGRRVVQIGISDFANSPAYAARARELGITVINRTELEHRPMADAMARGPRDRQRWSDRPGARRPRRRRVRPQRCPRMPSVAARWPQRGPTARSGPRGRCRPACGEHRPHRDRRQPGRT